MAHGSLLAGNFVAAEVTKVICGRMSKSNQGGKTPGEGGRLRGFFSFIAKGVEPWFTTFIAILGFNGYARIVPGQTGRCCRSWGPGT